METAAEKARIRIVNRRNLQKRMQDKKREEQRRRYLGMIRAESHGRDTSNEWKRKIREIAKRGVFDSITERGETVGALREAERIARIHGGAVFLFHEWRGFCDSEYVGHSDYKLAPMKTGRQFEALISDAENATEGYSLAMRIIARNRNGVAIYSKSLI